MENRRVSTGLQGLDKVIDDMRLGDNVVWQVESLEDYKEIVSPYLRQSKRTAEIFIISGSEHMNRYFPRRSSGELQQ